ncbi:MAG: hypothetical protein EBT67_02630 [Betaproteobacteria bacterium]|nr:hypothetical protein [Betaproteobacteria bacterium]
MGAGRSASSVDMSGSDLLAQTQLPAGARILHEQSTVIGSGNNWVGRVVIDSARDAAAAYSYFLDNYPTQGWTLLSAVRAKTSVMVFTKQEHNVTIEIQEGSVIGGGSAIVVLTRAPRNANDVSPAAIKALKFVNALIKFSAKTDSTGKMAEWSNAPDSKCV